MFTKQTKRTIVLLLAVSIFIYMFQILVFHDPTTTEFYLLQDLAFMPITIIVATIVVGEVVNEKEKRERKENTKMVTSTFYTQIGGEMMGVLVNQLENKEEVVDILQREIHSESDVEDMQQKIRNCSLHMQFDEAVSDRISRMLAENRMALLVLSSNPMILEQRSFTNLLWGLFHLEDEFRLRGSYAEMTQEDRLHLAADFEKVLRLLLLNSVPNAKYLQDMFPSLYQTAQVKLFAKKKD